MSIIRRLFPPTTKSAVRFQAKLLGPAYDRIDGDPDGPSAPSQAGGRIRLREGPSAGQEFQLTFEASDREAHVHLRRDGEEVGHCDFERDAPEVDVVLWYIWVTEASRRHGLASIMARFGLRQMLELHKSASYAIRMLRLINPSERITKIRNVGIAVLSRKLGLASEYDLGSLLTEGNVQGIDLIDADEETPPGYRIVLKDLPYVLIVFLVDPENGRLAAIRWYGRRETRTGVYLEVFAPPAEIGGIAYPAGSEIFFEGELVSRTTVKLLEINPALDESLFRQPDSR